MKNQIFKDANEKPRLFHWNGRIEREELINWFKIRKWNLTDEMIEFYCMTGGGEIFESETILGLYSDQVFGDDLESMNKYYRNKGMPINWLLFHIGIKNSALNMDTLEIIVFDSISFNIFNKYKTFSDWYINFIREEYKERYNLK